ARGVGRASGIADRGGQHAFHALKDRLRPPEAAPGKDRGRLARRLRQRGIAYGGGNRWLGGRLAAGAENHSDKQRTEQRTEGKPHLHKNLLGHFHSSPYHFRCGWHGKVTAEPSVAVAAA